MNTSRETARGLDAWIQSATRGLCTPAAERIGDEIRDYYQSAMDDALARGVTDEEAHTQAMMLLGSPRRARSRFRREHLTCFEARALAPLFGECPDTHVRVKPLMLASLPFLLCGFLIWGALWYLNRGEAWGIATLPSIVPVFFAFVAIVSFAPRLQRYVIRRWSFPRHALVCWSLGCGLSLMLFCFWTLAMIESHLMRYYDPVMDVVYALAFALYLGYDVLRFGYLLVVTLPKLHADRSGRLLADAASSVQALNAGSVQR